MKSVYVCSQDLKKGQGGAYGKAPLLKKARLLEKAPTEKKKK